MASDGSSATTRTALVLGVGLGVLILGYFAWGKKPPQMGADEEVFRTVDALFTAVTARDGRLLARCEQKLLDLKNGGKLPTNASHYLDGIVTTARAGRWEAAAESLYGFMMSQRREGTGADQSPAISKGQLPRAALTR